MQFRIERVPTLFGPIEYLPANDSDLLGFDDDLFRRVMP